MSALVLAGCEIKEPKLLKPGRPKIAWTQWSFPWYRRALTSLFAGLELTPSPAFSAVQTEAVWFLIGSFFLVACGFPFFHCSSHLASLKLDHCFCGLQDCFLYVILLWLSGLREEGPGAGAGDGGPVSLFPHPQNLVLLAVSMSGTASSSLSKLLSHLLKESTYLPGGLPGSVLSLTLPLGQSLFRP